MWQLLYQLASPRTFYRVSKPIAFSFACVGFITFMYGLYGGLVLAPPDYQQGEAFRIIYVHVPSAFMSLTVYLLMAFCAILFLVWKIKLADIVIRASAPIGAWFTFLALFSGAMWGKPMWGTWWIWDARLTSEFILLFLYLGLMALQQAFAHRAAGSQASAVLVLIGTVNIPIIHYSVYWWNTLHQGATISRFAKPSIALEMLYPLMAMLIAFFCFFIVAMLLRTRCEIVLREQKTQWFKALIHQKISKVSRQC